MQPGPRSRSRRRRAPVSAARRRGATAGASAAHLHLLPPQDATHSGDFTDVLSGRDSVASHDPCLRTAANWLVTVHVRRSVVNSDSLEVEAFVSVLYRGRACMGAADVLSRSCSRRVTCSNDSARHGMFYDEQSCYWQACLAGCWPAQVVQIQTKAENTHTRADRACGVQPLDHA